MAREQVVKSDLSKDLGAQTVTFNIGSSWYDIDLTDEEVKEMEAAMAKYVEVARKTTGRGALKIQVAREKLGAQDNPNLMRSIVPVTSKTERQVIRKWARENGYEVQDKGRLGAYVVEAYDRAHGITNRAYSAKTDAGKPAQVRAWARENGIEVPQRGKLSKEIMAQYDEAHSAGKGRRKSKSED